jgi:hypothetical protein
MVIINPMSVNGSKERIQLVMRLIAGKKNQNEEAANILMKAADYIDSLENIRLALVDVIESLNKLVPKVESKEGKFLSQNIEQLKVFAATFYFFEKVEEKDEKVEK